MYNSLAFDADAQVQTNFIEKNLLIDIVCV